jgi:hypothetical protein
MTPAEVEAMDDQTYHAFVRFAERDTAQQRRDAAKASRGRRR